MDKGANAKPYIAGVVFAMLVGFSFLSVKVCVPIASTIEIMAYRYNFAFIGVSALVIFRFGKLPRIKGKKKAMLFLAAGFYVLFMIIQAAGLIFSTSVEGAVLFAIIPIIAKVIAGIFLKEKSTGKQNAFVCLSVAALIIMIVLGAGDLTVNVLGIILLAASSVSMALSNVLMRYVRKLYRPFDISYTIAALGFLSFNIGYLAYMLTTRGSILPYFEPCARPEFVFATLYLGIPCVVVSAWLLSYMLAHMEAVKATIFGNLSTAISIAAGIVILGEPFAHYNIICTAVIIASVIGVSATGTRG